MVRTSAMNSRVRPIGLGNGWPYQPSTTCGPDTPTPRMSRPPERWSMVAAVIATHAGVRAEICRMPVPSLIFVVRAPIQHKRRDGVGAVRLRRPHRVVAQALGLEHQLDRILRDRTSSSRPSILSACGLLREPVGRARRVSVAHTPARIQRGEVAAADGAAASRAGDRRGRNGSSADGGGVDQGSAGASQVFAIARHSDPTVRTGSGRVRPGSEALYR